MSGERDAVFEWAESGRLEAGHIADALCVAGAIPGALEWRRFVDRLLLGLAVVLAGAGIVFFVAANWQQLPRERDQAKARYGEIRVAPMARRS